MWVLQHQSNRHCPVRRDRCALDVKLPFYLSTRDLKVRPKRGLNVNMLIKNCLHAVWLEHRSNISIQNRSCDLISLDNNKRWGTNDGINGKTLIFDKLIRR